MSGITDRSFRIITNSLELALETESCENIRTVLLGGEVWKRHTLTADNVSEYFSHCHRHHTLLLSADGIHRENGLSIFESRPMATMQEMIRVSDRVVLLSDSGKFGQAHFNRLADWKDIDLLVTDAAAPTGDLDFIRKQDIEVIIV
jgi:DeoR family transcriptional regulator of aga operon